MTRKNLIRWMIVPTAAFLLLVVAGHLYWTRGVYVSVTNKMQNTIQHMDIAYSGGVIHVATLAPGASYGRYVNPKGESDLSLEWSDSSGVEHSHTLEMYFEHNYAGSVQATVEPDGRVSVDDRIKLTPIDWLF